MTKYAFLTGDDIVKKIRSSNRSSMVFAAMLVIFGIVIVLATVANVRNKHDYLTAIMMLAVAAILFVVAYISFKAHWATLKDVRNCEVFRKYGSPDELAANITGAIQAGNLVDSKQTLIGDTFLLDIKNFESYMSYDSVRLLYKKEHRTNGILDGIYLVAWDEYGYSHDYPFKIGKRNAAVFESACAEVANRCKNARFGYNAENLRYAQSFKKKG